MHIYLDIFGHNIPSYGSMVVIGLIISNLTAFFVVKKTKQDLNDLIILEGYGILGGVFGAKLLYLIVSANEIDWSRILEPAYIDMLMRSGFVFYGGLIGALLAILLAGKIHKIDAPAYLQNFIFMLPLFHCFGRIGCFLTGCCYGIPYNGPLAVTFPAESLAVPGVPLFPVQLAESFLLLLISLLLLYRILHGRNQNSVELYIILYGITRFSLEFLRYDSYRGIYFGLSTSQWISMILVVIAVILLVRKKNSVSMA